MGRRERGKGRWAEGNGERAGNRKEYSRGVGERIRWERGIGGKGREPGKRGEGKRRGDRVDGKMVEGNGDKVSEGRGGIWSGGEWECWE